MIEFYKTSIKGISLSKKGAVKNTETNQILKITKRGYFIHLKKPVNLPKLMLETFRKIKPKTGRIRFIDGNKNNFEINNLEYFSKLENTSPPSEPEIIEIIKFYYGKDEKVNIRDVFKYRIYLKIILDQRNFFENYKSHLNIFVFKDYFSISYPSFLNLAKRNNITISDAKRTVYFFINKLIEDCKTDKIIKL